MKTFLDWTCYLTGATVVCGGCIAFVFWVGTYLLDYVLKSCRMMYGAAAYCFYRKEFRQWLKEHGSELATNVAALDDEPTAPTTTPGATQ